MRVVNREGRQVVEQVARELDLTVRWIDDQRKHITYELSRDGRSQTYTMPKTPSDWRSVKNMRARIRRDWRQTNDHQE